MGTDIQKIKTVTLIDLVVIVTALCGAIFSLPFIHAHQPATVVIYKDTTPVAEYPLDEDREITIKGHKGPMTIVIKDKCAYVHASTCRKQICVKSGRISKPYQQLICAPNHILIEIHSNNHTRGKIDAIAQ